MVSKKVLKNIGVFAMTAMLAAAPALAVSANMGEGVQLSEAAVDTSDPSDPTPDTPVTPEKPAEPGNSGSGSGTTSTPSASTSSSASTGTTSSAPAAPRVSYNVVGGQVSTVDGHYSETTVAGVAVLTPYASVLAAFGAGEGSTVTIAAVDSTHGPLAGVSINDGLARLAGDGVAAVKGAEIDILAYLNGQNVIDIAGAITITAGIPASFQQAGYDYAVIRVQEGGRVSILTDKDQNASTVTFDTNGFGVFVMVKAPAGSFDKYK